MAKSRLRAVFFCQGCGHESPKWMGFCPSCGEQSPLVEKSQRPRNEHPGWLAPSSHIQELSQVSQDNQRRIPLAYAELNRVLGGGLVPGSLVLMAGEPGIGKSTLLLQIAGLIAATASKVMYVSGEESLHQIKLRSERLGLTGQGIYMLTETDVDQVVHQLEEFRPDLAVVDSIQTLHSEDIPSGQGSVAQVSGCGLRLMQWAKAREAPMLIAGHLTKDGSIAGPRVLEHMVDVVLYLEGENLSSYRVLRGAKNRFGSTNEVGIFEMGERGLEEVADPSSMLLSEHREGAVGAAVVPILEGTRPLLVEVQALTSPSSLAVPRRVANGVDPNRLLMLAAVLTRRVGLNLSSQDIIVNVVGGLTVREPAADLAISMAIASSLRNSPLMSGLVALGEVGLSGELRSVPQLGRRLSEAGRLGFQRCLIPSSAQKDAVHTEGVEPILAATLAEGIRQCLPRRDAGQLDQSSEEIEEGFS